MEHLFAAKSAAEAFPVVLLLFFVGYFLIAALIESDIAKQGRRRRARLQSPSRNVRRDDRP